MILPNNPSIDVEDLMRRVRAEAARLRTSGAIDERRLASRDADDVRLAKAIDRHHTASRLLETVDRLNHPRTEVPKRFARLRSVAGAPMRFVLRVYNYLWKQQRELNANQAAATREIIAMAVTSAEYVAKLRDTVESIERYRTTTIVEMRERVAALEARLLGLEHSHHITREIAEKGAAAQDLLERHEPALAGLSNAVDAVNARIDSGETTVLRIAQRLDAIDAATQAAAATANDAQRTMLALDARVQITATQGEVRLQIVDALRDADRRINEVLDRALRADALMRGELAELRRRPAPDDAPAGSAAAPAAEVVDAALYEAIEDRFRGQRTAIERRLAPHLATVREAGSVSARTPLLDIGAGRGEWLRILADRDVPARGVDTNPVAVDEARAQGLSVEQRDGIAELRGAADGTFGAITAFHVVEHLPFGGLAELLREALRALVPGGVLLLETPNPANLLVATRGFYLDPTHLRPLPSPLLALLVEAAGFADVSVVELNPPDEPIFGNGDPVSARLDEFFSCGQDYAIIARSPR